MPRSAPKPGLPVRGSTRGRPIMALLDLLGRRWTLRILWELREAPLSFRALQTACGQLSPSVLNLRLRELGEVRLLSVTESGYALTPQGDELLKLFGPISDWAEDWAAALKPNQRKHN